ncbi:MAG: aminotransferase class III-fold pyridoxal phosphate-dependent enzyme [Burkholderiales bacterium]
MINASDLKALVAQAMWHPVAHPGAMRDHPPRVLVGADGVHLTDVDGCRVLDAVGGIWNVNLGYSCEPIKAAITRQLNELPYASPFSQASAPAIRLSEQLRRFFAADGLSTAFFTAGGSDSVETALRLARQYHRIRGESGRSKFISLKRGYHGSHFGGASVNGNAVFRQSYEPLLSGCMQVPVPYTYRNAFGERDPERLSSLCLDALEQEIIFQGPHTIAAFIMEPVLGAGGVIVPPTGFMAEAARLCRHYGVLFIADEVITGFGRAGAWSGSRLFGVQPDLMCLAKAITNGYFPFGAVMISSKLDQTFSEAPADTGFIGHGYTSSAHPVGAAAALVALEEMSRLDVAAAASTLGERLLKGLRAIGAGYPEVGEVRGAGLMLAMELVNDPVTASPMPAMKMQAIQDAAYRAGVLLRINGPNLIVSPPLVISVSQADEILVAVAQALDDVLRGGNLVGANRRRS